RRHRLDDRRRHLARPAGRRRARAGRPHPPRRRDHPRAARGRARRSSRTRRAARRRPDGRRLGRHGVKQYLFTIILTATVTFALSWVVWQLSLRFKLYPGIRERDVHTTPTPRLGGVAIFLGIATA